MATDAFRRAFAARLQQSEQRMNAAVRGIAMWALSALTQRSPVGNAQLWKHSAPPGYVGGRFKANWQVEIGSINYDISQEPDASGGAAVQRGSPKISEWDPTSQVLYITNSMPYAKRIEFDHWSQQAPAGLVRITAIDVRSMFRQLVKAGAA
jgi:hypothetical protein